MVGRPRSQNRRTAVPGGLARSGRVGRCARTLIPYAPALAFAAATLGFGVGNVLAKLILERGVEPLELLPIRYVVALLGLGRYWPPQENCCLPT